MEVAKYIGDGFWFRLIKTKCTEDPNFLDVVSAAEVSSPFRM